MNTAAWEKRLLLHLPYGVIGLAAAKLSEAWRLSAGTDFSAKFLHLRDGMAMAFRNGLSGFVPLDLLIGFLCGCALCLLVHAKRRNAKKYRHGEEYGAARWGKPNDIAPFMDADPWNNIILTQTERLTMSSRPANPKTHGTRTYWSSAVPAAAKHAFSSSRTSCSVPKRRGALL